MVNAETKPEAVPLLKLDLGCGKNKKPGFLGVDSLDFPEVDCVTDLRFPWPWDDESAEEAHCSHFVEHLTAPERIHFVNELYRVLAPGGKAAIIVPHWASNRAYGDLTHQWPPVSEMWFFYLCKAWREKEAPHTCTLYTCDFDFTAGYSMRQDLQTRNQEYQQFALANYKEVAQDIIATITKPLKPR
jgi:SAM-dependent methyltransferase